MLQVPRAVEMNASLVGTQVWKVAESRYRNSFSGSQYCGRCGSKEYASYQAVMVFGRMDVVVVPRAWTDVERSVCQESLTHSSLDPRLPLAM